MSSVKLGCIRFLLVCWLLAAAGVIFAFVLGVFSLDADIIKASLGSAVFFFCLLAAISFIFFGFVDPRRLIQLIKAP